MAMSSLRRTCWPSASPRDPPGYSLTSPSGPETLLNRYSERGGAMSVKEWLEEGGNVKKWMVHCVAVQQ